MNSVPSSNHVAVLSMTVAEVVNHSKQQQQQQQQQPTAAPTSAEATFDPWRRSAAQHFHYGTAPPSPGGGPGGGPSGGLSGAPSGGPGGNPGGDPGGALFTASISLVVGRRVD